MTYSESAKGVVITRERLIRELADHQMIGFEPTDDEMRTVWECAEFAAIGKAGQNWRNGTDRYDAHRVLVWLGY